MIIIINIITHDVENYRDMAGLDSQRRVHLRCTRLTERTRIRTPTGRRREH